MGAEILKIDEIYALYALVLIFFLLTMSKKRLAESDHECFNN